MSVVKINAIHVPAGAGAHLEERFAARAGAVEGSPGFLGFQLLRPVAGDDRYFVVTHWEDDESFDAWREGAGMAAHARKPGEEEQQKPVSTGADLLEFEVVLDVRPTA
jgi:heme-degrading monooxygenase HmoA